MNCPHCGGKTNCTNSRPTLDGKSTRRRRECPDCLNRFSTLEVITTKGAPAVNEERALSRVMGLLAQAQAVISRAGIAP